MSTPEYDARELVDEDNLAIIWLDEIPYVLRITTKVKLLLTKPDQQDLRKLKSLK